MACYAYRPSALQVTGPLDPAEQWLEVVSVRALSVLGGRPHLIKAESVNRAFAASSGFQHLTLECWLAQASDYPRGSHDDFELPVPSAVLRYTTFPEMTDRIGKLLARLKPDVVLLYGDLDVTLAALIGARTLRVPVIHIESGYRSGDLTDREEHNRVLVDHGASHRVVFSANMKRNLVREGIPTETIHTFGNPALQSLRRRIAALMDDRLIHNARAEQGLVTFHHDENLLSRDRASLVLDRIEALTQTHELIIIEYKQTLARLGALNLADRLQRLRIKRLETLSYDEYVRTLLGVGFVVTDSSGLQDECSYLQKPCLVMRGFTPRHNELGKAVRLVDPRGQTPLAELLSELPRADGGVDLDRTGRAYGRRFRELLLTTGATAR